MKKHNPKDMMPMNALYSYNFQPIGPQNSAPAPASQPSANGSTGNPVTPSSPVPLVYTIPEAAALLHVNPKTIRRLLARGQLTACKVLRKKLIPRSQIEAFLKATCDQPKPLR